MSSCLVDKNQVAHLLYEIMLFAAGNEKFQGSDTPKCDIFRLMRTIVSDLSPISANGRELYIRELKKSGDLWHKVRPFIRNNASACSGNSEHSASHKCGHDEKDHKDGKCTANHQRYEQVEGFTRWQLKQYPCTCTQYIDKSKW